MKVSRVMGNHRNESKIMILCALFVEALMETIETTIVIILLLPSKDERYSDDD